MSRTWFSTDLETVATYWRVLRRDGVALGFTSHDRDLWFDGLVHAASPGMVPFAIRRTSDLEADSAEVQGALTHDAISAADLAAGLFDQAQVRIGLVDWETGEHLILYAGAIGAVSEQDGQFSAELVSRKAELKRDPTPRTSPSCRATFCGPGCNLSPLPFTHEVHVTAIDFEANAVTFDKAIEPGLLQSGTLRWLDGPQAGMETTIMGEDLSGGHVLAWPIAELAVPGCAVRLREGCDRTLGTCASRFSNAVNFQGEPYLPGNDLLVRYPSPPQ